MNTMVILVNERPESRAALDWTLKGQPATTAAGDTKPHVVLGPSTDIPGGPRYVSPSLVDEVTTQIRNSGITHTIYAESTDPAHQGLLLHSIYHRPGGWDHVPAGRRTPCGESSMWGDYHLRELALYLQRVATDGPYYTFFGPAS